MEVDLDGNYFTRKFFARKFSGRNKSELRYVDKYSETSGGRATICDIICFALLTLMAKKIAGTVQTKGHQVQQKKQMKLRMTERSR